MPIATWKFWQSLNYWNPYEAHMNSHNNKSKILNLYLKWYKSTKQTAQVICIGILIKCLELYLKLKAHLWTNRNPKSLNSKHVVKKLVPLEIAILAFKLANFDLRTKSWNIEKTAIKGKMIWSMRNPCFEDKEASNS